MGVRRAWKAAGVLGCLTLAFFGARLVAPLVSAADGMAANIELYDMNGNGYVDAIKLYVVDALEDTWVLAGSAPYGLSVQRGGEDVTVTGVAVDSTYVGSPGEAVVTISLDETDPDLIDAKDTSASAVEIVYTSQLGGAACTNCVRNSTVQLEDIPVGDGGDRNIEYDRAIPLLLTSTTQDDNGDGYVDALALGFSEPVIVGDGESSTNGMFTAVGDTCTVTVSDFSNGLPSNQTQIIPVSVDELDTGCKASVTFHGGSLHGPGGSDSMPAETSSLLSVDGAAPYAYRTVARDQNKDGTLDKLDVYFSESVDVTDGGTQLEGTLEMVGSTNHIPADCTPSIVSKDYAAEGVSVLTLDMSTETPDTGCVVPLAIVTEGNILDAAGLSVVSGAMSASAEEDAPPVLLNVSPEPDQTDIALDSPIAFLFSEAMDIGFDYGTQFTASPNPAPGTWNGAWGDEYHLTQTADGAFLPETAYTMTLVPAEIHAIGGITTELLTEGTALGASWTFTTVAGEGGGGGGGSNQSRVGPVRLLAEGISLTEPVPGAVLEADGTVIIKWAPVGPGRIDAVNLSWSPDGGLTWEEIAHNRPNGNGSYAWKVPSRSTDAVLVRVEATDTASPYASDVSDDYLSIRVPGVRLPSTETYGPGTLLKAEGLPSVYYLAENGARRPFPDERVFHTWFKNFDEVREIPLYRIARYRMGAPMLPKPGTAFLQINSDPKLYWIDRVDSRAHWVKSESTAALLAGPRWRDMVIDLGATIFPSVLFGNPIE